MDGFIKSKAMKSNISGEVSILISASKQAVWNALTDPAIIKQYLFGTNTITTWEPGTQVIFEGEWQGKKYQDKGTVLVNEPGKMLQYNYWSSMSGIGDEAENYMIVTYLLDGVDDNVTLTLRQENIPDEKTKNHSMDNWKQVLASIKKILERK